MKLTAPHSRNTTNAVANPHVGHLHTKPMTEYISTRSNIRIKLPLISNTNSDAYTLVSSKAPNLNCAKNIIDRATLSGMVKKCMNFGLECKRVHTMHSFVGSLNLTYKTLQLII